MAVYYFDILNFFLLCVSKKSGMILKQKKVRLKHVDRCYLVSLARGFVALFKVCVLTNHVATSGFSTVLPNLLSYLNER